MAIQERDQYAIPIAVKLGDVPVTPNSCDDITIKLLGVLKTYSKGELTFNSAKNVWEYPLTEAQTRGKEVFGASYQVGVLIGTDTLYSEVETVDVNESIITEDWK